MPVREGKNITKSYRQGHHDHLLCTRCKRVVKFEHPPIEKLQMGICLAHGFTQISHRMELFGICAECLGQPETLRLSQANPPLFRKGKCPGLRTSLGLRGRYSCMCSARYASMPISLMR
ncbi:MAG: transcriptional repressor [Nitrospinaceae bacterium]|nr:MAG: transcriptional repressor [Nitrospinaceae bacterium]